MLDHQKPQLHTGQLYCGQLKVSIPTTSESSPPNISRIYQRRPPSIAVGKFPEGPTIPIPAIANGADIPPGEKLSQAFAIYDDTTEGCYPAGEYVIQDHIGIDGIGDDLMITVTIHIDDSRAFTVEASSDDVFSA